MPVKAAKDGGFAAPILINEKPRELLILPRLL
jgi:hypothetical protein